MLCFLRGSGVLSAYSLAQTGRWRMVAHAHQLLLRWELGKQLECPLVSLTAPPAGTDQGQPPLSEALAPLAWGQQGALANRAGPRALSACPPGWVCRVPCSAVLGRQHLGTGVAVGVVSL